MPRHPRSVQVRNAAAGRRALAWAGALAGGAVLGWVLLAASPLKAQDVPALPDAALAQEAPPPGTPPPPPPDASAPARPLYSAAQLEQMVAPIALYPDDLLGQILMAATYPLEVVQADRWLQNPDNAALQASALTQALEGQPWEPSVKSLAAYPQVLTMMDEGLDWTEALGDAFLAQQGDVMDAVQRLRARARSAGTLASTPQEQVSSQDGAIQIAPPPDTGVEYVPVYDPSMAYGPWPYPEYPPDDLYVQGYPFGTFITVPILVPYWGWDHWDWHHHRIDIDGGVGAPGWSARGPGGGFGAPARHPPARPWHHDPSHRDGVPYRDPATRAKFQSAPDPHAVGGGFRGYNASARAQAAPAAVALRPIERPYAAAQPAPPPAPVARPAPAPRAQAPRFETPRVESRPAPAPVAERPVAPAFESFGHGPQVHAEEQRGVASRAAPPEGGGGARPGAHR